MCRFLLVSWRWKGSCLVRRHGNCSWVTNRAVRRSSLCSVPFPGCEKASSLSKYTTLSPLFCLSLKGQCSFPRDHFLDVLVASRSLLEKPQDQYVCHWLMWLFRHLNLPLKLRHLSWRLLHQVSVGSQGHQTLPLPLNVSPLSIPSSVSDNTRPGIHINITLSPLPIQSAKTQTYLTSVWAFCPWCAWTLIRSGCLLTPPPCNSHIHLPEKSHTHDILVLISPGGPHLLDGKSWTSLTILCSQSIPLAPEFQLFPNWCMASPVSGVFVCSVPFPWSLSLYFLASFQTLSSIDASSLWKVVPNVL